MDREKHTLSNEHIVQDKILDLLASTAREGNDTSQILKRLQGYTQVHFHCEELIMKQHDYDRLVEHETQHLKLLSHLDRFDSNEQLSIRDVENIRSLLKEHTQQHDEAFARQL